MAQVLKPLREASPTCIVRPRSASAATNASPSHNHRRIYSVRQTPRTLGRPVIRTANAPGTQSTDRHDGDLLRSPTAPSSPGIPNQDLRLALFGESDDAEQRRKQSAAVTRKLRLLRPGLIIKVQRPSLSGQCRADASSLLCSTLRRRRNPFGRRLLINHPEPRRF
jgi:hypothetical protein